MNIVTSEGQVKQGDKLQIVGKNTLDDQITNAEEVITVHGREEIIIDVKANRFIGTHALINGNSWAKQVCIIDNPTQEEAVRGEELAYDSGEELY